MKELLSQLNFKHIFFKDRSYPRADILAAIDHLANYLKKNIHSPSPFILFTANNHLKTLVAYFAILKCGKIAVVHDPLAKALDWKEAIDDTDPAAIITIDDAHVPFNYEKEVVFRNGKNGFMISSDLTNVCTIAYTNAEDGFSKGAMITEDNLLSQVSALVKVTGFTSDSVNCALVPFSHLYGFAHGILLPALGGGSGLITEFNLIRINQILQEIYDYKVTQLHSVPSIYYILSKIPNVELRFRKEIKTFSAGIQLPRFIYETFYQKARLKIWEGYGLTECAPGIAVNQDVEEPVIGSFGRAFPGCTIRVKNEKGNECMIDEIGEICVKGTMIFKGYFNHPQATDAVLKDGWFQTGDFGKKDKDGNFYFCGLKKNMINTAGNKVYPKKLERLLKLHENALEVNVFSEPSLLQGDIIKARIKLQNTAKKKQEELKRWCQENINNSLLPKIYEFY
jgi:long-chain acyl-CoA synthetase